MTLQLGRIITRAPIQLSPLIYKRDIGELPCSPIFLSLAQL